MLNQSEEEIQVIIQHWIRIFNIKLGWIKNFDRLVVNYATIVFILDTFRSSSKLLKTFTGHTNCVNSIDYSAFDGAELICSGSNDKTVRVWDVEDNEQIQLFNEHSNSVYCVKFSPHHYHNYRRYVICSSSFDKSIRFWSINNDEELKIFNGHVGAVFGIEFSPFCGGRYLCSGSGDKTIRLWDLETSKSLHAFNGHTHYVWCVAFSPLQRNDKNDNNKSNNIGLIGGNGYTICSGSFDKTVRIWDIETTKQFLEFKGHYDYVRSVKYGSNKLKIHVRLWDIRSGQQIQVFNGHKKWVNAVEYSPFVINNLKIGDNTNVICSGSLDNTIRFWDIRSNKDELHVIKGDDQEDGGICCFKFFELKAKEKQSKSSDNLDYITLCYGSGKGRVRVWG
ncbi:WD-40 repeat-containing protein [Reticulomyxa filosa]|uniref:WD-40 repeat-containing protein n=1 Tax=Reticulomyxa filosa TaxID=46433 RepID=X6LRD3_RETFI|nr:WD-40 repeat-containing protein [Reticulomyxa filosa]|eukprot:ETO03305.1 WD-40 repeat-containing protein [Reticulomyxa filosa]